MFRFGSKKDVNLDYKCTIRLLDDNEVLQSDFQREHKGQYLVDYVCTALNLIEKDYFGLRYVDAQKQRHWLDPTKSICKQIKGMNPILFCFRLKYFPPDPYRLKEEITRYQVFLQLRRDLLHGRLYCSQTDAALLSAYIIQSELGDFDHDEHPGNYVADFKLLLKQTPKLEEKIAEIHQTQLRGQVPAVAEINFLRKACILDTYGVDPHPIKDHKGNQLYLGINHTGILTFQGSRKTHHFKWQDVQKINYEGKMFIVHLLFNEDARTKKKHLIGFKCPTHAACHHLWKCAVEQRYFFTLNSSSEVPSVTTGGGIFSRASRLRFSGRVEKEVVDHMRSLMRDPPHFRRSFARPPFRNKSDICSESPTSEQDLDEDSIMEKDESVILPEESPPTDSPLDDSMINFPLLNGDEKEFPSSNIPTAEELRHFFAQSSISKDEPPAEEDGRRQEVLDLPRVSAEIAEKPVPSSPTSEIMPDFPKVLEKASAAAAAQPPARVSAHRLPTRANAMRAVVLTCLLVLLLLSCLLVVVMESDSPLFGQLRKLPEMIVLRHDYYEPAKDYFAERITVLFQKF